MIYLEVLWKYLLLSAPYLVIGLLASGVIHQFVPIEKVKKWLGGNKLSNIIKASLIGVPLPLCSCSVIPTAVTLRKAGASNGSTSAFLISTPESGVDSISITYALIDLPMTIIRPVAAFFSGIIAGLMQFKFNDFVYIDTEEAKSCCSKNKDSQKSNKFIGMFQYGFGKLINDIAAWLAVGILLGALIDLVVPASFFADLGAIESRFMILLVGIPLYICASASTPIAASLMLKGLSPGCAILFLLVGPATNISNIAVLQKFIGKKGVLINVLSIAIVALIFSYLTDYLYQDFFSLNLKAFQPHHEHGATWWETACAVFISALIIKGIYVENIKPKFKKMVG